MFPCDWCGTPIDHYAAHFAEIRGRACQEASRFPKLRVIQGGKP